MNKELQPHQQRIVDEARELWGKAEALDSFIKSNPVFDNLPELDKQLLTTQLNAMRAYGNILDIRINRF